MPKNHRSEYEIHVNDMPEGNAVQILKKAKATTSHNLLLIQDAIDILNFGKRIVNPKNDEVK